MSYDQSYSIPSIQDLLEKLTGFSGEKLLIAELACQGILITKRERFQLDNAYFGDIIGERIFLSDGRVYEPKLVREETANGNSGLNVYEYRLIGDKIEPEHIDTSDTGEDVWGNEGGGCNSECGCLENDEFSTGCGWES